MSANVQVFKMPGALARRLRRRVVEMGTHGQQTVRWEDSGEVETADAVVSIDLVALIAAIGTRALSTKTHRTALAGGAIKVQAVNIRATKGE